MAAIRAGYRVTMRRARGGLAAATLARSGGDAGASTGGGRPPCPPRGRRDQEGYELWLAHQSERWDPALGFLGIVFALLAGFDLADPGLSPGWSTALDVVTWGIWSVFVVDFLARLVAAPSTTAFLRGHWLALAMLAVPALRILRLGALLRLGRALPAARVVSTSYRATGVARKLLRSRTGYLAAVAAVSMLAVAELGWLAEREHGTFESFGDALIWAATSVIALQGDPNPVSAAGRLVMLFGFAVGLVLVATLAGTVGAYMLEDRREREEGARGDGDV